MKKILLFCLTTVLMSCGAHQQEEIESADPMEYANSITPGELKEHLFTFASDDFEGRETGEPGQKKAAAYLKQQYQEMNIPSPLGGDDYFQEVDPSYFRGDIKSTENVVAYIEGSEKPEQVVVISSHYDHIGINDDGQINNGADDDGREPWVSWRSPRPLKKPLKMATVRNALYFFFTIPERKKG